MHKYYKYQYRFNASHSFANQKEHMHTFTVTIYVSKNEQAEQIMFFDIDKVVQTYLQRFEQKYLNDMPEFTDCFPNVENIGDIFFEKVRELLADIGIILYQLDIYENPLSVYQVSSRIHIPACYVKD